MREGPPPKDVKRGFHVVKAGEVHPDRWVLLPTIGWDPRDVAEALDELDDEIFKRTTEKKSWPKEQKR